MNQAENIKPRTLSGGAAGAAAVLPPLGALIAALNWRHFGKRDWMINSLLILLLYVIMIVLVIALLIRQPNNPPAIILPLALGTLVFFWVFYLATQILQGDAYKHWVKYNTLDDYHYNFTKALGISAGVVVVAGAVIGASVYFQSRPNIFTHPDMTISVPSAWEFRNLSEIPDCANPTDEYSCIAFFAEERFGFTQIFITRERPYTADMTLDDHVADWEYWVEDVQGGRIVTIGDSSVNGMPAKQVAAYLPPDTDDRLQEEDYTETMLVQRNGYLYSILIWAENKGIFEEDRRDIENFLNAMTFV